MNATEPQNRRTATRTRQLANLIHRRIRRRYFGAVITLVVLGVCACVPLYIVPKVVRRVQAWRAAAIDADRPEHPVPTVEFKTDDPWPICIEPGRWTEVGLQLCTVASAVPAKKLSLDGVLFLDPEDYIAIRSRFVGEFVDIAKVPSSNQPGGERQRPIRFGDDVKKGQVLGAVWSRELGEKKSELAQVLSTLKFDRETLSRLNTAQASVAGSSIRAAEQRVSEGEISVERIEKILRSWQLSVDEVEGIVRELTQAGKNPLDPSELTNNKVDRWARIDLRSPIDGTIVEKNVTLGSVVDQDDVLFKIADLSHLDVRVFAYEEDVSALQRLPQSLRKWSIQLKSDPTSTPIEGLFDRIGELIDPVQHTGVVMGWVDNRFRSLRPGQFVTATVVIPDTENLLAVPSTAVVDFDGRNFILCQNESSSDRFQVVEVDVARHQSGNACLRQTTRNTDIPKLEEGMRVVSSAAMEIFSEYQSHLATKQ